MAWNIFPTESKVGSVLGAPCDIAREFSMREWMLVRGHSRADSFVDSGLDLSATGTNTVITIASGIAMINGQYCFLDASTTHTVSTTAGTYQIYATINITSNLATSITIASTTGSVPSNSVALGQVIVAASVITSANTTSSLKRPGINFSTYSGDNATSRNIYVGWAPKLVMVVGATGVPANAWQLSTMDTSTSSLGMSVGTAAAVTTVANTINIRPVLTSTGFQVGTSTGVGLNISGNTYQYLAFF